MKKLFVVVILAFFLVAFANSLLWSGESAPAGYWTLNETSGDAIDFSTGVNNGTVDGGVERGTGINGVLGTAYNFTRATVDSVNVTYNTDLFAGGNFTISMWVNRTTDSALSTLGLIGNTPTAVGVLRIRVDNTPGEYEAIFWENDGSSVTFQSAYKPINEWEHVVFRANGTRIAMFSNTTLINSVLYDGTINQTGGSRYPLRIGHTGSGINNPTQSFGGLIDEVGIWNRSLTDEEIADLYNAGAGLEFGSEAGAVSTTLVSPASGTASINQSYEFFANVIGSNLTLTNATYFVWDSAGAIFNQTSFNITGAGDVTNETSLNISGFDIQQFSWNTYGCGNLDNGTATCAFAPSNFTLTVNSLTIDAEEYPLQAFDTDNATFAANLSLVAGSSVFSARLVYNGTTYGVPTSQITNSTATSYRVTRTIDLPPITTDMNRTWFWNFTIDPGGTGFRQEGSSVQSHTVNQTNFTITSGAIIGVNYTLRQEESLAITPGALDGTFEWFLGGGSERKNNSFDRSETSEHLFYLNPNNESFYTFPQIFIFNESVNTSFSPRIFEFPRTIYNNDTTETTLYLANASITRNFQVTVEDLNTNSPLTGVFTQIERFYPRENKWRLIESRRTDLQGQFVARLVEGSSPIYRVTVLDENGTLIGTPRQNSNARVCENTGCTLVVRVGEDVDFWEAYDNIQDYQYQNISFNNATGNISFIWNDFSGSSPLHSLLVVRRDVNGTTNVCDYINSTETDGVLQCNVGSTRRASYTATAYRLSPSTASWGAVKRIDIRSFSVGNPAEIFGAEGLFWAFILLFTLLLVGFTVSAWVGMVLYLVGVIAIMLTGVVYVSPLVLIGNLIIGGLFIWAFNR